MVKSQFYLIPEWKALCEYQSKRSFKGYYFLKQGKTNKVIELSNEDAFPLLLSQIDLPKYEIKEEWGKLIDSLLELPLYLYECNMEAEAFYTLEKQLRNRGVFE